MFINFFYFLLYLSALSLWFGGKSLLLRWQVITIFTLFIGLAAGTVKMLGVTELLLFSALVYLYSQKQNEPYARSMFFIIVFIFAGFSIHFFPGFNNLLVMDKVYISQDAVPFSLYLNIDKTIPGIVILGLLHQRIRSMQELLQSIKQIMPIALTTLSVTLALAMFFHYVRVDFKLPNGVILWAVTNLCFVCLAEEALFRGLIQKTLSEWFCHLKYGALAAISIAAVLFGLAHYQGGPYYVFLASVAGFGYGMTYRLTNKIEMSILTHFLLNLIHILFFTYPALQS